MNTTVELSAGLPENWAKLGASIGFNPKPLAKCRIVWLGPPKTGKSTIELGNPRTLLIDIMNGADSVVGAKGTRIWTPIYKESGTTADFKVAPLNEYQKKDKAARLVDVMTQLVADAKLPVRPFDRVVFDYMSALQDMMVAYMSAEIGENILETKGGKGGWQLVHQRCLSFLRGVAALGYGWGAIEHLTETSITVGPNDSREVMRPSCAPGISKLLEKEAEYLIRFRPGTKNEKNDKGVLISRPIIKLETQTVGNTKDVRLGGRVRLPREIEVPAVGGWNILETLYNEECERIKNCIANNEPIGY